MITSKRQVHVTAAHIENNRPGECRFCAVAQALNDALGGEWHVSDIAARDGEGMGPRHIRFPSFVTQLIRDLDCSLDVQPFSFEAEINGIAI